MQQKPLFDIVSRENLESYFSFDLFSLARSCSLLPLLTSKQVSKVMGRRRERHVWHVERRDYKIAIFCVSFHARKAFYYFRRGECLSLPRDL
jgi:hypothetical protein